MPQWLPEILEFGAQPNQRDTKFQHRKARKALTWAFATPNLQNPGMWCQAIQALKRYLSASSASIHALRAWRCSFQ